MKVAGLWKSVGLDTVTKKGRRNATVNVRPFSVRSARAVLPQATDQASVRRKAFEKRGGVVADCAKVRHGFSSKVLAAQPSDVGLQSKAFL